MSKIFRGQAPGPPFKGEGRERREGKGRKGEGEGERRGEHPQIKFYDYSTVHTAHRKLS
jgi:hypothetical protein